MALSIGVHKGSRLKIADKLLEVVRVVYGHTIEILIGGVTHHITEQQRTEVLPDVFVSYGASPGKSNQPGCRLCFEAPRSVRIERV